MHNGHRVPLPNELNLLLEIRENVGWLKGAQQATDKRLDRMDRILLDTAFQVRHQEGRMKMEKPSAFRQWSDVLKLLWPFLMLIIAITSRVLSGDVGWLIAFLEHVKIQ